MNTKKCIFLLLILIILLNITSINAMENITEELKTNENPKIEIDKDILTTYNIPENNPTNNTEILSQNNNEEKLSDFTPLETQINIMINDTSKLETTGNITINMHFSFTTLQHNGEFPTHNINIYENNTKIKTLNIGEQNLPELKINSGPGASSLIYYNADILFNYTLHENSYLITSLFGIYSNTLHFKEIKTPQYTSLDDTQINIDNEYFSNNTWNNSINSLKKALNYVKNNGTIYLENINLLQDIHETLLINKNITIIGNNATFKLQKNNTLIKTTPDTNVTFINLTFRGNNPYIISNQGRLQLINCTFKDNTHGLIENDGELIIKNTRFNDILQFNQETSTNNNGLINNNGLLEITETLFNNNINLLPYNIPTKNGNLKAVINNNNQLIICNTTFSNINHRIIYNTGKLALKNNKFENITSASNTLIYKISSNTKLNNSYIYDNYRIYKESKNIDGGAIHTTNETNILNCIFKNINGNNGGCIYNTGKLDICHSLINKTQSKSNGGSIYNIGAATLENTTINNSETQGAFNSDYNGGGIYNNGILIITNSKINKCYAKNGGGIYNNNIITLNNSIISECKGVGAGIYNTKSTNITNTKISNNYATISYNIRYETSYTYYDAIYSGAIYNAENADMIINKSTIIENSITRGDNLNWQVYYGTIKNDGKMEITGCIFDNNKPSDWSTFWGGDGSINIYNNGKITVMYNYLLNTQTYTGNSHNPYSFLYHTGSGTCNINYNFFCLNAQDIIKNSNPNYYFVPSFDDDYYPIKLNQTKNITLTLKLTNGTNIIVFNDWDKLPQLGLNTTITTIDEHGKTINITTLLKDKITFNFNNTHVKSEYIISANILNYKTTSFVEVGKEFANMTVNYTNITYKNGTVTFHINVTGNITMPTGNITITFNNQKTILNLTNGTCTYTVDPTLIPGNYTIKIEYDGDEEYFKIRHNTYKFTIYKIPVNVTLYAPDIKIGETGELTIKVTPTSAKMTGYYYINGKAQDRLNTQNLRTIKLKNFALGTYNLTVKFTEDKYYTGCEASIIFTVKKWQTNITLQSKDINTGENATLNLTINPGDVRGDAILEINGVNKSIYINKTTTPITITNLQNGTYTVTVYYMGDNKYLPSNASTTFSVSRKTTALSVNITNNEDLTGNILVKTDYINCTGPVGVYINTDPRITLNLTDGQANFTVKFKRGTNYIYVYYLGDDYYSYSTWNTTINIEGKAIITTNNTIYTEQITDNYTINLKDTDNNPYEYTSFQVTFQNQTHTLTTDDKGNAYFPVKSRAGTYNITVSYKNYTKTDSITVTKTKMGIIIDDILAGQTETITITLPINAKGNITILLDNNTYNRTLISGKAILEIPDLKLGQHNLTVIYTGDENYTNQTVKQTFYIKNSLSWITLKAQNTTYGEEIIVTAHITTYATGNVTFTLYNQTQTVNLTGNTATVVFKNIPAGERIITAHYNGDSTYQGSTDTVKVNIARKNPTIKITTSELKVNQNIQITTLIEDDATGNITYRIEGLYSPRNRTITNGNSTWIISPLNSGSYKLIVIYNGDNNYNTVSKEEILIINQIPTKMTISIPNVIEADDLIVYAKLTDIDNNKITGNVTLEINGKYYKIIVTNGEGSRNLGEFKVDTYKYYATYTGTSTLSMATDTGTFNITPNNYKITENKDINAYYGANTAYKIKVTNYNKPVTSEIVSIQINENTVKVKTDNQGYATLKLSLKAGSYTITATYKNIKISNKITIKPTLITKNKKIKKGKTLTYTAKLLNTKGKALKNKKITFKINGKKYKAKTNKKGIAKIKVKNLKVGKHKIQTTYGKQKNTNTITVKK